MNQIVKYRGQKRKYVNEDEDYNRGFISHCRPRGIQDLVKNLNEKQLEAIKSIGFGGLLTMSVSYMPVSFVKLLVKNFNGISRMLTIDGRHSFLVTKYDVCDVFLLPLHDGKDVVEMSRNESVEIMSVWKEKYGVDRVYPLSKLKILLEERLTEGDDDFKRFFVLYALSSFLTPTSNGMVDFNALKSLVDVEKIGEVDWCSYVLKQLCKAVTKYNSSSEMKNVSGCVLVLLILYFHRLKWRGIAEPYSLPLIQHWNNEKLRRRASEEMSVRALGQGEWVEDVYPVSLKSAARIHKEWKEMDNPSRFIKFELPMDELCDSEIRQIAADDWHECFLKLRRDMSVVVNNHMKRLLKLKKKVVKENGNQSEGNEEEGAMIVAEEVNIQNEGNEEERAIVVADEVNMQIEGKEEEGGIIAAAEVYIQNEGKEEAIGSTANEGTEEARGSITEEVNIQNERREEDGGSVAEVNFQNGMI